jgi:hypothetical protein
MDVELQLLSLVAEPNSLRRASLSSVSALRGSALLLILTLFTRSFCSFRTPHNLLSRDFFLFELSGGSARFELSLQVGREVAKLGTNEPPRTPHFYKQDVARTFGCCYDWIRRV